MTRSDLRNAAVGIILLLGVVVDTVRGFSINSSASPLFLKHAEALRLYCEIDHYFDSCSWTLPSGHTCAVAEEAAACHHVTAVMLDRRRNRCMLEVERADIFRDTGKYTCTFSERFSLESFFSSKSKTIEVEKRLAPRVDLWTESESGGVFPVVVGRETEVICHADRGLPRPEITASVGEEDQGPSPGDRMLEVKGGSTEDNDDHATEHLIKVGWG